jgi:hypothetical protein
MKTKFTYKEFTLLAGVVVALIIMITLWINPVLGESGGVSGKSIPTVTKPAAKVVIKKVAQTIQNSIF